MSPGYPDLSQARPSIALEQPCQPHALSPAIRHPPSPGSLSRSDWQTAFLCWVYDPACFPKASSHSPSHQYHCFPVCTPFTFPVTITPKRGAILYQQHASRMENLFPSPTTTLPFLLKYLRRQTAKSSALHPCPTQPYKSNNPMYTPSFPRTVSFLKYVYILFI